MAEIKHIIGNENGYLSEQEIVGLLKANTHTVTNINTSNYNLYPLTNGIDYYAKTHSGDCLIEISEGAIQEGKVIIIKDETGQASLNNITVQSAVWYTGVNINGATNSIISSDYGSLSLIRTNGNWWSISSGSVAGNVDIIGTSYSVPMFSFSGNGLTSSAIYNAPSNYGRTASNGNSNPLPESIVVGGTKIGAPSNIVNTVVVIDNATTANGLARYPQLTVVAGTAYPGGYTAGVASISTMVVDGVKNRRAALFYNYNDAIWGLSDTGSSGSSDFALFQSTRRMMTIYGSTNGSTNSVLFQNGGVHSYTTGNFFNVVGTSSFTGGVIKVGTDSGIQLLGLTAGTSTSTGQSIGVDNYGNIVTVVGGIGTGSSGTSGNSGSSGSSGVDGSGSSGTSGTSGYGIPIGGTSGQVLAKIDGTNYNTQWVNQTGGGLVLVENGLTSSTGIAKLGGSLNQDTFINGSGYNLNFNNLSSFSLTSSGINFNSELLVSPTYSKIQSFDYVSGEYTFICVGNDILSLRAYNPGSGYFTGINLTSYGQLVGDGSNSAIVVSDPWLQKGISYLGDYTGNFTTYSLVTKGYVDSISLSSGSSGTSGTSGNNGSSGTSGVSGSSGTSGVDGSGSSGTSGVSGSSGSSGTSGNNGTSGTSGINGSSGTSGNNGSSGTSGADGSGSSGTSGIDGSPLVLTPGLFAQTWGLNDPSWPAGGTEACYKWNDQGGGWLTGTWQFSSTESVGGTPGEGGTYSCYGLRVCCIIP